jgi:hypothetical protein
MPDPRTGFSRVRDIATDSSNGSFAILFTATWLRCWRLRTFFSDFASDVGTHLRECQQML